MLTTNNKQLLELSTSEFLISLLLQFESFSLIDPSVFYLTEKYFSQTVSQIFYTIYGCGQWPRRPSKSQPEFVHLGETSINHLALCDYLPQTRSQSYLEILSYTCFKLSDWLQKFEQPIRIIKNESSVYLSQNFFLGQGPVLVLLFQAVNLYDNN